MITASVENTISPYLRSLAQRLPRAAITGAYKAAAFVSEYQDAVLLGLYDRPIPTVGEEMAYRKSKGWSTSWLRGRPASQPLWERTDDLWNSRGITYNTDNTSYFTYFVGTGINQEVPYEYKRETLWAGWTPKQPAMGVVRKDPWYQDSFAILPEAAELFRVAFTGALYAV